MRQQEQPPETDWWQGDQGRSNAVPSPGSRGRFMDTLPASSQHLPADAVSRAVDRTDNQFGLPDTPHSGLLHSTAEKSHLIGLYYSHFHHSHPMLVPRAYFAAQHYPEFLVTTMCLIGQHFASFRDPESTLPAAIVMVQSAEGAESSARVQASILLALISLGSHKMDHANKCLAHAVSLAAETRLDSLESHMPNALSSIKQESLRRTWWELFSLDALLALLQGLAPRIAASNPHTLPRVPLADKLYESGVFNRRQPSYAEFERRLFLRQPGEFCSHFYRIQAIFIVRQVQPLFTGRDVDPEELEAVCNDIASWSYCLDGSSFALPGSLEDYDQILIQAHVLVQIASIFLHFPRSRLPSSAPCAADATCLSKGLERMERSTPHGSSAVAASRELCRVASMPFSQVIHSPIAVCAFLLGSAVQLASASSQMTDNQSYSQRCRNRVVLMLGALKQTGKAWSSGLTALHRVQPFADLVITEVNDHNSGRLSTPAGSSIDKTSNLPVEFAALGRTTGQNENELNIETTSQDDLLNMNWFEFFQSVDP